MLSAEIELDDAYIGATKPGSKRGRGCGKAAFIVAVEKGKKGACALRAVSDLTAGTYKEFARDHICKNSHIRTDGFVPLRAGLASWPGLDARAFDAGDEDCALRSIHHVISNFKSMVIGTCHGVSRDWLQSYMDEFCWRYAHRHDRNAFLSLIGDMRQSRCRRAGLPELFAPQAISGVAA